MMCALSPHAAAKTNQVNVYRRPIGKYRYTVCYRAFPGDEGIEVVRVIHSARIKNLATVPDEP